MATKRMPLPRKTVENRRSSTTPIWSRTTPMNQRKAMPANGTRFSPACSRRRRPGSADRTPGVAPESAERTMTSPTMSSTAKTIPATAADLRVRHRGAVSGSLPGGAPRVSGAASVMVRLLDRVGTPLDLARRGSQDVHRPRDDQRDESQGDRLPPP